MADQGKVVDAARFGKGFSFGDYLARIENNREVFQRNYELVQLREEDRAFFANLPQKLSTKVKLLVLAEDWCPDVCRALPIAARIAEASPDLELRIFPRDENLDIMNEHLNQGQYQSIPTFVFFDEHFQELGRWIERPRSVNAIMREVRAEATQQNLAEQEVRLLMRQRMAEVYASRIVSDTIDELKGVLSR